ncbi:MAG: tetratricopeptide repeat protein, partial [Opitutae bacterium]|nr:tetratricopeptide repeat protein [Opitutae bacterium]
MRQPLPTHQGPHGEKPADAPVVEPGFEIAVHEFWDRNRNFILMLCAAALLVIAGREGWQYFANAREKDLQADYARVGDSADRLAKFADEHAGHALAGVAYLRVADEKFSAGDFKSAATAYQKATNSLRTDALLGRARLGAAVSRRGACGLALLSVHRRHPTRSREPPAGRPADQDVPASLRRAST